MAVTVKRPGSSVEDAKHERGKSIQIKDGHLLVLDSNSVMNANTIAIYSPEAWRTAVVDD